MAECPQPQPRHGVLASQLDRRLEADERLTDIPRGLRLPPAVNQALDFRGHGD